MTLFLIVFLISLTVGLLTVRIAHKKNIFIDCHHSDKPQRFHERPTPRAGGIGIFAASTFVLTLSFGLKLILPFALAFASGLIEDFTGRISQKTRLIMQSFAAVSFIFIADSYIKTIGLGIIFPYPLAILFTVFAIVGVTNAINIIDGLNGLAGGISASALVMFSFVSFMVGDSEILLLCLILIGALLGFLALNFPNAKIFLGDGGAYFVGFALACISIMIVQRHPEVSSWFCVSVLAYPIWEVLYSIARRRKAKGKKAMGADKMHLHHVVMRRFRLSNPRTSFILLVAFLPFQIASLFFYDKGYVLFAIITLLIIFYNAIYWYTTRYKTIKNIRQK